MRPLFFLNQNIKNKKSAFWQPSWLLILNLWRTTSSIHACFIIGTCCRYILMCCLFINQIGTGTAFSAPEKENKMQSLCHLNFFLIQLFTTNICKREANRRTCNRERQRWVSRRAVEGNGAFCWMFLCWWHLVMLSLQLPPHLHPWCYGCKSAVLCVWTPIWSCLKNKNTTTLDTHNLHMHNHKCG